MKPYGLLALLVLVLLIAAAAALRATGLAEFQSNENVVGMSLILAGALLILIGSVGAGFSADNPAY